MPDTFLANYEWPMLMDCRFSIRNQLSEIMLLQLVKFSKWNRVQHAVLRNMKL